MYLQIIIEYANTKVGVGTILSIYRVNCEVVSCQDIRLFMVSLVWHIFEQVTEFLWLF